MFWNPTFLNNKEMRGRRNENKFSFKFVGHSGKYNCNLAQSEMRPCEIIQIYMIRETKKDQILTELIFI
jgi:hypothetical protein